MSVARRWKGRSVALLGLVLMLTLLWPSLTRAGRPVIPPGREGEIEALFEPHELGHRLTEDWLLHSFSIDGATIIVWLEGPEKTYVKVRLDHPDFGPADARGTPSFDVSVPPMVDRNGQSQPPPEGSAVAVDALVEVVNSNDDGQFWVGAPTAGESAPAQPRAGPMGWVTDGLVLLVLFVALLGSMVAHKLTDAEPWQRWALLGVVAVGVALRLTLPVGVAMAPWAYTRVLVSARLIHEGPGLALVHPGPIWLTDTIHVSTLFLALLAPLAIFVHARYLLVDRRAALVAAALVAVMPLHLRFAYSDAAFIPSITVSSLTFALVHAATREKHPVWRWVALVVLPFPVALTFLVRPLNLMYFPLLLATAFVNEGLREDKEPPTWRRIGLVAAVVSAVTFGVGVPFLMANFEQQVHAGLSVETLTSAAALVFDFEFNVLINPRFMPTGVTLLAIFGAVELIRRRRLRLFAFLVLWLGGFFVAHAYVVPIEPMMQARYHLHLLVPFVLLAVAGFEGLLDHATEERLGRRGRQALFAAVLVYIAASPLLHRRFIQDVDFNEMREWVFVHDLREVVPAGCVVLEHTGAGMDSRMERVGAHVVDRVPRELYRVVPLQADDEGRELSEEALELLRAPPECLYFLQALPCVSAKPEEERLAPVCHAVPGWLPHAEVAKAEFESRVYDGNYGRQLGPVDRIELVLYRLDAPPSAASGQGGEGEVQGHGQ